MNAPAAIRASRYVFIVVRWLFIATIAFVASKYACEYIVNNVLPQTYTAKATLQLPASDLIIPSGGPGPEPVAFQPEFENTIRSPDFLLSVIKDLGLEQAWAKRLHKVDDQLPDVDALTRMENALSFTSEPGTQKISIIAASDLPQEASDVANAVADRYKATRNAEISQPLSIGGIGQPNPVSILTRAEVPSVPTHPNRTVAYYLTLFVALSAGLVVASFVEIIFLFLRASERMEN